MSAEPPIIDPTAEVEVYEPRGAISSPAPLTLFGTADPVEVVRAASRAAEALSAVIKSRGLAKSIQGRNHVFVEGWTLLGSMLGVFPVVVWTRKLRDPEGWEARVEAQTRQGDVVGAAEAQCTREENLWSDNPIVSGKKLQRRDDYALRSMAQTRATSKALRAPLGFIIELAGYNATPAEEMPSGGGSEAAASEDTRKATQAQHAKLNAMIRESDEDLEKYPLPPEAAELNVTTWLDWIKAYCRGRWQLQSRADLTRSQMGELIEYLESARIPFS